MTLIDAALSAFYPVIVLMGAMIVARFWPLLAQVEATTKPLICSMLVLVIGIGWEHVLYGYGRFSGDYINIALNHWMVGIGKTLYMVGFAYLLYAFWVLSPTRPRLATSFFMAGTAWLLIFVMLVL